MHRQFLALREAHRSLATRVEAQGHAAETVAEEASSAALQATSALQASERVLDDTREWVRGQLDSRPTAQAVEAVATKAAEAVVRSALADADADGGGGGGGGGWLTANQNAAMLATHAAREAATNAQAVARSSVGTPGLTPGVAHRLGLPGTPAAHAVAAYLHESAVAPLEARVASLEAARVRLDAALDDLLHSSGRSTSRLDARALELVKDVKEGLHAQLHAQLESDLSRRFPSIEQVRTGHPTSVAPHQCSARAHTHAHALPTPHGAGSARFWRSLLALAGGGAAYDALGAHPEAATAPHQPCPPEPACWPMDVDARQASQRGRPLAAAPIALDVRASQHVPFHI